MVPTAEDPLETQRDVASNVATELTAAGFEEAHEIGHGGFGVVYRCVQPELDRTVAVKVLTAELDQENTARFFREQRAMGRLTGHPNIVNVLQVGVTGSGRPYIVMPYHPRDSLDARIRKSGPLPLGEVLRLGVKIAGALETGHRLGILHRDVKPANILLTDYGEPALTDFGIAHISGGFETATGTVTGSPAFTAPEVLRGDPPSPASDIYGLGATLFCAVTGHAAFERRSGEQVIAQFLRITSQPVPDLREKGIPEDVSAVVARAMAADPADRPATAAELGDALRQMQADNGLPVDDMAAPQDAPGRSQVRSRLPAQPTAHSLIGADGNLPLELTSFIGRRRELTEAKAKLSDARLVTLTGIGGVGKTRLALRVAADVRRGFADGAWLVELGELHDESLLVDVVAAALGLRDGPASLLKDTLVDFLAARRILLVFDNCEQVVGAVARLSETLLRSCPNLRILATSREPLGIGGEVVLRVPPLTVPDSARPPSLQAMPRYDAVTLFADRAAAAVPGFELTEENTDTVALICQRLDGLPLPIELAAARLRAMSAEQILRRLTDRYALLTLGSRGAPTRQQTLRLSIDWSYELCSQQEQQLWAQLSVFAGSFELDAAEGVCAGPPHAEDLLDTVTSLVDKSILIREESASVVRFRMLETLRDYGSEKLTEAGEADRLRRRHRDWYLQLAEDAKAEWISREQVAWMRRLAREQPNLREAMKFCLTEPNSVSGLRFATALFLFWLSRGMFSEGRHWLDRFLETSPVEVSEERVAALYGNSVLAEAQNDVAAGASLVAEGKALAAQTDNVVIRAHISHAEGVLKLFTGDLPGALECLESALEVSGDCGRPALHIEVLDSLGTVRTLLGDSARAIEYYERVLEITESTGESMYRSHTMWAMGVALWRQGDVRRASRYVEDGLALARRVDSAVSVATCLETLAWIAGDGDPRRAAILMGAAESLAKSTRSSTVLFPDLLVYHEECGQRARSALGRKEYESAWDEGRTLVVDDAVAFALGEQSPKRPSSSRAGTDLTKREREVADLVAEGLTNKQIAARLVISPRTAQGHVEHLLAKLGFASRTQIAAWVAEQGRT
ncbi:protein kinase [Rhodococcus oxybenzonivorans]|uniref:protein kinase domain-containing protein n=1 Tax=Rhodococcus oxybenzonivorans TaxID=1990687 RepID=UPI002955AC55|nr:protein kinase [Rhodococcus oxybenzonivorans]MDV7355903.1 protein kinase [Rhodococcus oxybenzonivorans]